MLVDTHLHINSLSDEEVDNYVEKAKSVDVLGLVASFCEKDDILLSTKYVEKYKNLYVTIGYHPEVANRIVDKDLEILENLVKSNKKIVGIGEIGLDYYWSKDNKEKQIEIFEKQLKLAEKLDMPVVIHTRDSIGECYEILKNYKVRGVIHCFSGSVEMARKFIDLGFYLGIGGVVTFKNSKLYQVIEQISLDNIVLETDSPYLSPEPNRGKTNDSSNVIHIARKLSDITGKSIDEVANITTSNAIKLFDLDIDI